MEHNTAKVLIPERRAEPRCMVNRPYCWRFSLDNFKGSYQFKIWNRTRKSMSLLVDKDSDILPHLKRNNFLTLMYYPSEAGFPVTYVGMVVRHITGDYRTRGKGHCLVGLEFLKRGEKS